MVSYIYTMAIRKWGQLYDHTFSLGSSMYRYVSQEKCHNGTKLFILISQYVMKAARCGG